MSFDKDEDKPVNRIENFFNDPPKPKEAEESQAESGEEGANEEADHKTDPPQSDSQPQPDPHAPPMFEATPEGLIHWKPNGEKVQLTNFVAKIVEESAALEDPNRARVYELHSSVPGEDTEVLVRKIELSAAEFMRMAWPHEKLGAGYIVFPGQKDKARAAIQFISGQPKVRRVFAETGWHGTDQGWVYVHKDGAIGSSGQVGQSARASLSDSVSNYALADVPEGDAKLSAIRASLGVLDAAPASVAFPLFASVWRSVLGSADFSVFLVGSTGVLKSSLATVIQQHFGPGLTKLPGNFFSSTENALELLCHETKDALVVLDEFKPTGTRAEVEALHKKADRVLRAQGNGSGKQRLRSNLTLVAGKAPRGLIVATGEEIPKGESLKARLFVIEVAKGDISSEKLAVCQSSANVGIYAQALAAFIRWIAPKYEQVQKELVTEVEKLRAQVTGHLRTATTAANLMFGFAQFLAFATEAGAITDEQAKELADRCWNALVETAKAQEEHQGSDEPAQVFLELLGSALATGAAHVASVNGTEPSNAELWGWTGNGTLKPNGKRVGWLKGSDLYLDARLSYTIAKRTAGGEHALPPAVTLRKRLRDANLLVSTESRGRESLTIRKKFDGAQRIVIHLEAKSVVGEIDSVQPTDPDSGKPDSDNAGLAAS